MQRLVTRFAVREIMTFRAAMQALGALGIVCTLYVTYSTTQSTNETRPQTASDGSPIYGVKIPAGYRDWRLIAVKQLTGLKLKQLRAQLGNDIAITAFRDGKLPFPDGTMIAALHWNEVSSDADNQVLASGFPGAGLESSYAGPAVNVQFMLKDSKKYAASGGWGFADFTSAAPTRPSSIPAGSPAPASCPTCSLTARRASGPRNSRNREAINKPGWHEAHIPRCPLYGTGGLAYGRVKLSGVTNVNGSANFGPRDIEPFITPGTTAFAFLAEFSLALLS